MKVTFRREIVSTAAILFLAMASIFSVASLSSTQAVIASPITASQSATLSVAIGEGSNATVQHYTYAPQSVEINAGESVTWFTPAEMVDIHTVTFVPDPSIQSDILLPFAVPSDQTDFELLPPFNLGEPILIQAPDGREAIVALNKIAWYPAVFDANNQTTFLEGTDIQATLNSTVKALNSGIILPPMPPTGRGDNNSATTGEATMGPPFPPVSSFTVTFEEPGTYPYFCAIHPWMSGQVVVRGAAGQNLVPPTATPSTTEQEQQPQSLAEETQEQLVSTEESSQQEEPELQQQQDEQEQESDCDPSYPDVCIPPPPPDLDCGEVSVRNFRVLSPDPHGLDGNDNDGTGCES